MTRKSSNTKSFVLGLFIAMFLCLQCPVEVLCKNHTQTGGAEKNAISEQSSENPVIVQIQTRDKILIIRSGDKGRLYTVKSRDGVLLAADLTAAEIEKKFPDLKKILEKGLAGDATLRMNNNR
jgi:hypothetical protein